MKFIDLSGNKYNRLTVVRYMGNRKWLCKCECGNSTIANGYDIKSGKTKSCGCYNHQKILERNYTHKMTYTHIYKIWCGMKDRCYRKENKAYKYYGGKGIKVCDKWLEFKGFYEDMYKSYKEHCKSYGEHQTTLDRKSTEKNYCKENCRWSTYEEQANNKTNNVTVNYKGRTFLLTELCNKFNIKYGTLYNRVFVKKWEIEKALNTSTSTNKTGYIGVTNTVNNTYEANITVNKKQIYLGRHKTIEKAIEARKEAELKYFGEYSYLNRTESII